MAEIKVYNQRIKKTQNIAVMSSTKETQPRTAQGLCSYLIHQDQNMWEFFRLLGPAVLLEEQHSLWKYYRTLEKKAFPCYTCPLFSGFDPA